jgi:hypothetical protein
MRDVKLVGILGAEEGGGGYMESKINELLKNNKAKKGGDMNRDTYRGRDEVKKLG